jgi:hypothetical protein
MVGFWVQRMGVKFADLVDPALFDLLRQEGICDRGPGRADHVQNAAPDLADHGIRGGEPTDPDDGLRRHPLHEGDIGLLAAFFAETGGHRVVLPVAHVDVPEVRDLGENFDDLAPLAVRGDALRAHELVDGQADCDRTAVADRILGLLEDLAKQANPVFEGTAVFVAALVSAGLKEMHQKGRVVARVDSPCRAPGLAGPRSPPDGTGPAA